MYCIVLSKLPTFFSRFWNPGASGIDFFAQELSSENCLVVPPVSLVARVIHYLSLQKAMATLVVPLWPSSSFWPLLTSKYRLFMKGCFTLPYQTKHYFFHSFNIFRKLFLLYLEIILKTVTKLCLKWCFNLLLKVF